MKIALISINSHTRTLNFASMIHSYSFQQFLLKNGIETTIINYKPHYFGRFDEKHPLEYYRDVNPNPNPKKQAKLIEKWTRLYSEREKRYDKFMAFADKYYIKTDKCYTTKDLDTEDLGFDCYICVTDVIWKYHKVSGFDKALFLASETMKGKKKIAYAASHGGIEYTPNQEAKFIRWISDFDRISVREESLQTYIKKEAGLDVPHVVDPVFLMPRSFYEDLAVEPEYVPSGKYVLIYLAMQNNSTVVKAAIEFARDHDMEAIELSEEINNEGIVPGAKHRIIYDIGVEEWLWYIIHSEYFFTNSFHGCCFSLILQKRFFAGDRGGDKIDSLLDYFDVQDRRLKSYRQLSRADKLPDTNYEKVQEKIDRGVEYSSAYILDAIHYLEDHDHSPLIAKPDPLIKAAKSKKKSPTANVSRAARKIKRGIKVVFGTAGK